MTDAEKLKSSYDYFKYLADGMRNINPYKEEKYAENKSEPKTTSMVSLPTLREQTVALQKDAKRNLVPIMRSESRCILESQNSNGGNAITAINTKATAKALRNSPGDKRLYAEAIADRAAKWDFPKMKVWAAFRHIDEEELLDVYHTKDDLDFYVLVTEIYAREM